MALFVDLLFQICHLNVGILPSELKEKPENIYSASI